MASTGKLPSIDHSTRYMSLRDAVCLIGRRYSDWQNSDIDELAVDREGTSELEAWDRASHAEQQLSAWILYGVIEAFDQNEYGRHRPLDHERLETPYFRICARSSRFLVFPDEWAPLTVDGPAILAKLEGVTPIGPRKKGTYEWRPIINQAWRIALEMEPPRTSASLVRCVDQWFIDHKGNGESRLGEKELKQVAGDILRYLGDRRLSGENSSPETSPDEPPVSP